MSGSVCPPVLGPTLHAHKYAYETFMLLDVAFEFSVGDEVLSTFTNTANLNQRNERATRASYKTNVLSETIDISPEPLVSRVARLKDLKSIPATRNGKVPLEARFMPESYFPSFHQAAESAVLVRPQWPRQTAIPRA